MRQRELYWQLLLAACAAALAVLIYNTTQANLARLGVETGFGFLERRAGFEIGLALIPFSPDSSIARAFAVALLNALLLAACSIALATLLGLVIGLARLSDNWLAAKLALIYVELFRNIPALLQIFFWYFVVLRSLPRSRDSLSLMDAIFLNNRGLFLPAPELHGQAWLPALALLAGFVLALLFVKWNRRRRRLSGRSLPEIVPAAVLVAGVPLLALALAGTGWSLPQAGRFGYEGGLVLLPEFLALVSGLSMYHASYISEVVRSGFLSVPRGQMEAATSLGMTRGQVLRLVMGPQALRVMLPPLTTIYLNMFKGTSLAAAIAYPEVVSVFVGTVNNLVGQPVAIMAVTLGVYVFVSLTAALLMNLYHRRIARRGG